MFIFINSQFIGTANSMGFGFVDLKQVIKSVHDLHVFLFVSDVELICLMFSLVLFRKRNKSVFHLLCLLTCKENLL